MTNKKYIQIADGVNFLGIEDKRFKTMKISVNFMVPLSKETASQYALLPFILTRASKDYPDYTKLSERLAELYGASLDADINKIGDIQVLSLSVSGISDEYAIEGEDISGELSKLILSEVYDPLLDENGLFPEENFLQEQRQLIEMVDSEFSDKRAYAKQKCLSIMCASEPYGIPRYGSREALLSLTSKKVTEAYKKLLDSARIEIIAVGNCDTDVIYKMFSECVPKNRNYKELPQITVIDKAENVSEVTERETVTQSKLVMGFRSGITANCENAYAMRVMCALFGGTPTSKLFMNVREKLSLCYYCVARFDPNNGVIFADSGVENSNVQKCKDAILKELESVNQGDFTDEEINATKLALSNAFITSSDYIDGIESWYLVRTFYRNSITPEEAAENIMKVTKKDIIECANKVNLDTVFVLSGGDI